MGDAVEVFRQTSLVDTTSVGDAELLAALAYYHANQPQIERETGGRSGPKRNFFR